MQFLYLHRLLVFTPRKLHPIHLRQLRPYLTRAEINCGQTFKQEFGRRMKGLANCRQVVFQRMCCFLLYLNCVDGNRHNLKKNQADFYLRNSVSHQILAKLDRQIVVYKLVKLAYILIGRISPFLFYEYNLLNIYQSIFTKCISSNNCTLVRISQSSNSALQFILHQYIKILYKYSFKASHLP